MLDIKFVEDNFNVISKKLSYRNYNINLYSLIVLIQKRRIIISRLQNYQWKNNIVCRIFMQLHKIDIDKYKLILKRLKNNVKINRKEQKILEYKIYNYMLYIPNLASNDVPIGMTDIDNKEMKQIGIPRRFNFIIKNHITLCKLSNGIDIQRAVKISGTNFSFLTGKISILNRALMQYFLNFHSNLNDIEITSPFMVNSSSMVNTGQLPKFINDLFVIHNNSKTYYMIPTGEVPLTNYYANEILDIKKLPIRFCSYTPCFRLEAGAAGKESFGLVRQHQFEKVEIVRLVSAEQAENEFNLMVNRISIMLSELGLAHRLVMVCTGQLGFAAKKTVDIEVWFPSQNIYKEISSCSICDVFQSRRAKIRYKKYDNKIMLMTTMNGSGLPLGRTLAAILENHQNEDGSINIPKVLWKFMDSMKKIL